MFSEVKNTPLEVKLGIKVHQNKCVRDLVDFPV